ncbi:resistance to lethality of mkk1p386 overexpression [Pestalotiopsis sp. IQ-011]
MSNSTRNWSRADYNKNSNPARYQPRVVDCNGRQFVVDDKPFFINPFMRIPKEERIRYKEERAAKAEAKAEANPKHEDRKYHPGDKPFFINPFRRVTSQHQKKKKKKKKPAAGTVHPDDAGRDPEGGPHMPLTPADRRRLGVRAKNAGFFDRHNADAALRRNRTEPRDFAYVGGEPAGDDFRWRKRDKVVIFCIRVGNFLLCPNPDGKAARADREAAERLERLGFPKGY